MRFKRRALLQPNAQSSSIVANALSTLSQTAYSPYTEIWVNQRPSHTPADLGRLLLETKNTDGQFTKCAHGLHVVAQ